MPLDTTFTSDIIYASVTRPKEQFQAHLIMPASKVFMMPTAISRPWSSSLKDSETVPFFIFVSYTIARPLIYHPRRKMKIWVRTNSHQLCHKATLLYDSAPRITPYPISYTSNYRRNTLRMPATLTAIQPPRNHPFTGGGGGSSEEEAGS